jgi:transposase
MSEQEMLVLSTKERDRLKVLHEVKRKHLTQRGAAAQLGISDRWVRKLLIRVKREGDRGVVHRLRGRPSKRRLAEGVRAKALELVKSKYGDFGPTLACEYLAKKDGVKVSKETLRQWLVAAGLRRVKRRKAEEVHFWRPRRSCRGELVQWDTSEHEWLEGRGPKLYLVVMIDDASSRAYGRFVRHDSTEENLRVLGGYLESWGRPVEFYTDKSSLFTVNRPRVEAADEEVKEELTQIGRALRELGIGWIAAHSPQAKGRIERFFGTAQDRLVKGLRLAGVQSLEEANAYLEKEYLPQWERDFTVVARSTSDAAFAQGTRLGRDPEPGGGTDRDLGLYDPASGEDLSDWAQRRPGRAARKPGAGGTAAGRERGRAFWEALPGREGVPASTEGAEDGAAEASRSEALSTPGRLHLDEGLRCG